MKVLVATSEGQGQHPGDYNHTVDGELVRHPGMSCDCPDCGCERGWAGLASSRATTTAEVLDRPDLNLGTLEELVRGALDRGGWLSIDPDIGEDIVAETLSDLLGITAAFPVGTVLERDGDRVSARRLPSRT